MEIRAFQLNDLVQEDSKWSSGVDEDGCARAPCLNLGGGHEHRG